MINVCLACQVDNDVDATTCRHCDAALFAPALGNPDAFFMPAFAPAIFRGARAKPGDDLAALVRNLPEGETLELGEGVFHLPLPLTLAKPITINGLGPRRTRIVCRAAGYVLRYQGHGLLRLHGVAFAHESRTPADVLLVQRGTVEVYDCAFSGGVRNHAYGENGAFEPGRGVAILGPTSGVIRGCHFLRNDLDGLQVGGEAKITVQGNTFQQNHGAGLAVLDEAEVLAVENLAHVNYQGGMAYFSRASGAASRNRCHRNAGFGIAVFNEARVDVTENEARGNHRSGIGFWNSARGQVDRNLCLDNLQGGIHAADGARPVLGTNDVG